jgi:transcriptional regulator with XRE-family HTH domain
MSPNVIPENTALTREQSARLVREARLKKSLTQKELADLSGISLCSLQRIENAQVSPRAYTWRQLAEHIDLEQTGASQAVAIEVLPPKKNLVRKWIWSIGSLVVIVLSFASFVIQSPTFPETLFETMNMVLAGCVIYLVILYRVWK